MADLFHDVPFEVQQASDSRTDSTDILVVWFRSTGVDILQGQSAERVFCSIPMILIDDGLVDDVGVVEGGVDVNLLVLTCL